MNSLTAFIECSGSFGRFRLALSQFWRVGSGNARLGKHNDRAHARGLIIIKCVDLYMESVDCLCRDTAILTFCP